MINLIKCYCWSCQAYKVGFAMFIVLMAFTLPVFADEPTVDKPVVDEPTMDDVNEIAKKLNCPTCQSLNLADCRTLTCEQWRGDIGNKLAEGYTKQQILDEYTARCGDEVLQEPAKHGIGLYAWLLPLLVIMAGVVIYITVLRQWSHKKATVPVEIPAQSVHDDYLNRVEEDLNKFG